VSVLPLRRRPQVKALHGEISAAEHEAQQLEAQHQHLKRQQAALQVGLGRGVEAPASRNRRRRPANRAGQHSPTGTLHPPLQERIARLEAQRSAKHDAAESSIEERLRDREAIEAENAAAAARLEQNEALVGLLRLRLGWWAAQGPRRLANAAATTYAYCLLGGSVAPMGGSLRCSSRPAAAAPAMFPGVERLGRWGRPRLHSLPKAPRSKSTACLRLALFHDPAALLPLPQMRKLQVKIEEVAAAHAAQLAAVLGEYEALLQQVGAGWGEGGCSCKQMRMTPCPHGWRGASTKAFFPLALAACFPLEPLAAPFPHSIDNNPCPAPPLVPALQHHLHC
jgi:hypothetical protein